LARLARQEKALFIKIDPEVVLARDIEPERPDPDGQLLVSELEQWGWRFSRDQIQFRNTVLLDLSQPEDTLLASMKQKTRYNIRLAGRSGVTVRPGDPLDFPVIAEMYRETAGRDGFAIRPLEYYLDAWQTLYDGLLAFPLIAEYGGQPLAAVIIVRSGNRAIYMYGASRQQERQRMPNHLLQWEAIRWAKNAGCEVYDFWGAPDEFVESDRLWGVWRFKEGFAGQVVRHIGAWDFPARPLLYWLYTALIPRYLAFLRSRRKPADGEGEQP
jgi:lipid II:glycine glycyltransferase (peptidoglycan interpeptide bridge formation enzyme)